MPIPRWTAIVAVVGLAVVASACSSSAASRLRCGTVSAGQTISIDGVVATLTSGATVSNATLRMTSASVKNADITVDVLTVTAKSDIGGPYMETDDHNLKWGSTALLHGVSVTTIDAVSYFPNFAPGKNISIDHVTVCPDVSASAPKSSHVASAKA